MISEIPFTMRRFWKRKSATENGAKIIWALHQHKIHNLSFGPRKSGTAGFN